MSLALLALDLAVKIFYASIHLTLHKLLVLFLAGMITQKAKTKYTRKSLKKFVKEFINNKTKELCVQEGILIDEVRAWFKANLFFIIFLALKTVSVFEI